MSDLDAVIKEAAEKAARAEVRRIFEATVALLEKADRGAPYPQPTPMPKTATEQTPRNRDRTRKEVEEQTRKDIAAGKIIPLENEGRGLDACCNPGGADCCE